MSKKLTPKQEAFVQAYLETGNASEAYRCVYDVSEDCKPNTIEKRACELLKNGKVAGRLDELQKQAAERNEITVDALVLELDEVRQKAMAENKGASAAVSAILGKAKLLGFLTERHELTGRGGRPLFPPAITKDMTPQQAAEAYAQILQDDD